MRIRSVSFVKGSEIQLKKVCNGFFIHHTRHGAVCRTADALIDVFSPMRNDFKLE